MPRHLGNGKVIQNIVRLVLNDGKLTLVADATQIRLAQGHMTTIDASLQNTFILGLLLPTLL
jgi:hypothetical protein